MPNWSSSTELVADADAFTKLMHCLAGVYFWEFFTSLDFEWKVITGKKKFQWPLRLRSVAPPGLYTPRCTLPIHRSYCPRPRIACRPAKGADDGGQPERAQRLGCTRTCAGALRRCGGVPAAGAREHCLDDNGRGTTTTGDEIGTDPPCAAASHAADVASALRRSAVATRAIPAATASKHDADHATQIFYFAGRYCLFFALIGIARLTVSPSLIALDATKELNCQALYTFDQLAGDAAVGLASINLSIRTMAVWSQSLYIVIPLVLVIFGHWSLILQGVLLKAEWVPGEGCAITHTNNTVLAATFIYSMCFDALVMTLAAVKLYGRTKRSQLVGLLFRDGLIYFFVAFIANMIATIFMCLSLNAVMSIIFNVPAAIASTIVACRAVRRLSNFTSAGPEVYSASTSNGGVVGFRSVGPTGTHATARPKSIGHGHAKDLSSGVHVQMQTFTVGDDDRLPTYHAHAPPHAREASDIGIRVGDLESGSETDVGTPVDDYKATAL
ncbi:hypothetical protein WOLCODRAFT_19913 [Wolfiporia cocos MD-104 SS10]|uniref:Transmembrane protein n=1 Tax=Wolfiporia cocos (strain MD-104) TaxID=742152 RepID=A0A2H3JH45_WOLCO|nr:hypothetical protein WOLCODRAFT_19913 [Wolfiporia cocos MD-104 SS10]